MIKERTIISTTVENSILYSSIESGKKYVLDIVAKDDQGDIYNIEMQCYRTDENDLKRFQVYGFRLTQNESNKGTNYKDIRPVRQLIINNSNPIKGLDHYIHHFQFYDHQRKVSLPYNLNEITIVQLAYLNMESIEIKVFDELMYLFKYNRPYDKIKTDKKIMEAIEMHDNYKGSNEWILAAERERDEIARLSDLREWEEAKKGLEQWEETKKELAQMEAVMAEKEKKLLEMDAKIKELEEKYNLLLKEKSA